MNNIVELHIAELFVGGEENVVVTSGIGSCIVIVLHDKVSRVGGMAHAILPRAENFTHHATLDVPSREGKRFVKFADKAVDMLVEEMRMHGCDMKHTVAKLIGGAHMFALLEGDRHGIGWENTVAAREQLAQHGIAIETEVVGGTVGRSVRFDCATGVVEIITKV